MGRGLSVRAELQDKALEGRRRLCVCQLCLCRLNENNTNKHDEHTAKLRCERVHSHILYNFMKDLKTHLVGQHFGNENEVSVSCSVKIFQASSDPIVHLHQPPAAFAKQAAYNGVSSRLWH